MPTFIFSNGNDSYEVATAGTFDLAFLAGADTLTLTHAGATTTADMGEGNDVVIHRGGTATVTGEGGADRFEVYASGLTGLGGADADVFNLRGGSGQSLSGGIGGDRVNFAAAVTGVLIHGDAGDDNFAGYNLAGTGNIHGDDGDDLFTGFRAGMTLRGGLGNDTYRVNPLSNATFLELAAQGTDIVQLMRGADYTLPANLERVIVGTYAGSDTSSATITLNAADNIFTGHGNDETVTALGGVDRLFGKSGNDTLSGDDGNDIVDGGAGNDVLNGGAGNDQLVGRIGDDTMAGGLGDDTYYVDTIGDAVTESVSAGIDTIRTTIDLTLGANTERAIAMGSTGLALVGNSLANTLIGGSGLDTLEGLDGNDILIGGFGPDGMTGGAGDDTYYVDSIGDVVTEFVGGGTDTVRSTITIDMGDWADVENAILEGSDDVNVIGNSLANTLTGNGGANYLDGYTGDDILSGGAGNDTIAAYFGADILHGEDGNDGLLGEQGNDLLDGGAGNDGIAGGDGADTIFGGLGADNLAGYDSSTVDDDVDTFQYTAAAESTTAERDVIDQFLSLAGEGGTDDQLDLSAIDANSTIAGDQAFVPVNGPLTGVAGQLAYTVSPDSLWSNVVLQGDVNGDGVADFELLLRSPSGSMNLDDITL